jgi:hypothetical protein
MTLNINNLLKAEIPPTDEGDELLLEAAQIIQHFVELTKFGVLQGNEASIDAKQFFHKLEQYFQ